MKFLHRISKGVARWLDNVAEAVLAIIGLFASSRSVELIEGEGGAFKLTTRSIVVSSASKLVYLQPSEANHDGGSTADLAQILKGNRAEIVLRPSRFVFRQVDLPRRASEFLDGVIRAQIDRLTPWSAKDAVFGWNKPRQIAADRIIVTVAATARSQVMPFVQAVTDYGAESVAVSTIPDPQEPDGVAIKVLEHKAPSALNIHRVRQALLIILVVGGLAAAISISAEVATSDELATRQSDLARRIAERRASLRAGLDAASNTDLGKLERRKHENPSTVIVLEALSQILPDHTFVTELRIEGKKVQIIGFTRDAPSLIGLIEQSPHFTHATFFAPTTRSPSDPGERFHIEARIEPSYSPRT